MAFPILLAWRLHRLSALAEFDPYPMVRRAAGYLVRNGPATPQERWEETSGYSPSTLAFNIAALRGLGEGEALAAPHRGAGLLRGGGRTLGGALPPGDRGVRLRDRAAPRAGLGRSGAPRAAGVPARGRHAAHVGPRRVPEAAPLGADGEAFGFVPEVADRYRRRADCRHLEIWKPNRRASTVEAGTLLRIQAPGPFVLRWTADEWTEAHDTPSVPTSLGVEYVDLPVPPDQRAPIRLAFGRETGWEGRDYEVTLRRGGACPPTSIPRSPASTSRSRAAVHEKRSEPLPSRVSGS